MRRFLHFLATPLGVLLLLVSMALAASYYLWDIGGQTWDTVGEIWDNTTPSPTPSITPTGTISTSTPTDTPTETPTESPSPSAPTETPTETPPLTTTPTYTFTATYSLTPITPSTPTHTLTPGGPTLTRTPTSATGCGHQTINRIPVRNDAFVPDAQNFMCDEDVERAAMDSWPFIYMGDAPSAVGSTSITMGMQKGFVDGGYFEETHNVSLAGQPNTTCWITAGKFTIGNIAPFTRVAGTHYLMYCGQTKPNPLDLSLMWMVQVTTDAASAATGLVDLRGFNPFLRTVDIASELNALPMISRGQLAFVTTTGELWFYRQDDVPVTVAKWEQVATGTAAVLSTEDQTVQGVKTFQSYPQIDFDTAGLSPTGNSQFATKLYVDSTAGNVQGVSYDPPLLNPGAYTTTTLGYAGVTTASVCSASHTRLGAIYPAPVLITAYPYDTNAVLVVLQNPTGLGVNIPDGILYVHCVLQ